ncbi:hypothetical protein Tco_0984357 [Tanacetum coccineum]
MYEALSSKKIDWNDPSVIRYHALNMKPKTIAQARRNMVKYLKNQGNYKIKHGSERMKSHEKIEEEDVDTQKEMTEVSKESIAKRKKYLPRKSTRSTVKRQKMELDDEKEDLKGYLDIVPREDVAEDVESLSTKGDGSSKNYKVLSEMHEDFGRQDVMDLHRLVKERIAIHMLIEKKYPLSQEMISKMLNKRLEVDHESSQAYELLKFIRSQVQK